MTALPTSTPAEQGVDARGVLAFVEALEGLPDVEPHSLVLLRHGHVVAQGWWSPYEPDGLQLLYSLSKSVTSCAAGLAVAEGLLDLDAPVLQYFPELVDQVPGASRALLVRHVASMASGHLDDTWERVVTADPQEPVRAFLRLPPDRPPGTVFAYDQSSSYTLAAIVQRLTGQPLSAYLRPRLLDPLGIGEVSWLADHLGRELGFSGLHATTGAVAALGQLLLDGGAWQGRPLLPPAWVAEATRRHVDTAGESRPPDWQQGYGLQLWRSSHGYRGDGAFGQFCLVLPEHDAVLALTAQTEQMQAVLDTVWGTLLPALGGGPAAPGGDDAALAERLTRLVVPLVGGAPGPPPAEQGWAGAFTPTARAAREQPSLAEVVLAEDADGWTVTLGETGGPLTARLGTGAWRRTDAELGGPDDLVPLAVDGGWTGPGRLRVDVLFVDTPHRLALTLTLEGRTVDVRWVTRSLHTGTLHGLRSPSRVRTG